MFQTWPSGLFHVQATDSEGSCVPPSANPNGQADKAVRRVTL